MQRKATVSWKGSVTKGEGRISTESGALQDQPYSFTTRFGEVAGTNPEELIAAAHAACFAMASSAALTKKGFEPESLDVTATVTVNKDEGKESWTVGTSDLQLKGRIAGMTEDQFQEIVEDAKNNCPISRLLNAEITLKAELEESSSRPWAPPPPQ